MRASDRNGCCSDGALQIASRRLGRSAVLIGMVPRLRQTTQRRNPFGLFRAAETATPAVAVFPPAADASPYLLDDDELPQASITPPAHREKVAATVRSLGP